MKIKLKLRTEEYVYVSRSFDLVLKTTGKEFFAMPKHEKLVKSILIPVVDKFSKKAEQLLRKNNLFDDTKTHSITLAYHDVAVLHQVIVDLSVNNEYDAMLNQKLLFKLDKKLQ